MSVEIAIPIRRSKRDGWNRVMLLGVVSDTHGHLLFTQQAVRMLDALEVDEVLHCGDIGSALVIPLFAHWPTHFVFGNVDNHRALLREAIAAARQTCHETLGVLQRAGVRIAFLHGDDPFELREALTCGKFDLVCHGHTHKTQQERLGQTLVVNPGAVYRANPRSIAVVELPSLAVTVVPLPG